MEFSIFYVSLLVSTRRLILKAHTLYNTIVTVLRAIVAAQDTDRALLHLPLVVFAKDT
jgi:hypothetical protein